MSIYKDVDNHEFSNWIAQSDSYKNNFSYEGANALQEYIDELSEDINDPIEFDPIAWCCAYSEYDDLDAIIKAYDDINNEEDLLNATTVIPVDGTSRIIIEDF